MQLRFCDADQFGHVNNSVYFQYYDTAKIHYMKTVCPQMDKKYAIVVVHIDADFLSQLHTDEHVAVQTAVTSSARQPKMTVPAMSAGASAIRTSRMMLRVVTPELMCGDADMMRLI